MNSNNPGEGLKMLIQGFSALLYALGTILLLLVLPFLFLVTLPFAILLRAERHWNHAKKNEEDWMSRREDYLSGKLYGRNTTFTT